MSSILVGLLTSCTIKIVEQHFSAVVLEIFHLHPGAGTPRCTTKTIVVQKRCAECRTWRVVGGGVSVSFFLYREENLQACVAKRFCSSNVLAVQEQSEE